MCRLSTGHRDWQDNTPGPSGPGASVQCTYFFSAPLPPPLVGVGRVEANGPGSQWRGRGHAARRPQPCHEPARPAARRTWLFFNRRNVNMLFFFVQFYF